MTTKQNNYTVCFVHGVGFHTDEVFSDPLKTRIQELTGANCIEHRWQHTGNIPPANDIFKWRRGLRNFINEAIMDFIHSAKYAKDLAKELPNADMYVAHSAGTLIIDNAVDVPRVMMGSPLQYVKDAQVHDRKNNENVLNIINIHDPLAAQINNVANKTFAKCFWNPVAAHGAYWKAKAVANWIYEWFELFVRK